MAFPSPDNSQFFPWDTVFTPQGAEFRAVRRGLGPRVTAIPAGADAVTDYLNQWRLGVTAPPQRVLVLGLAGSLTENLKIGDVTLAETCRRRDSPQVWLTDPESNARLERGLGNIKRVHSLTVPRPLWREAEKRRYASQYLAQTVEMENSALLAFFASSQTPVAILRVISDGLAGNLPNLEGIYNAQGQLKPERLLLAFARNPPAALRLIWGSLTALGVLENLARRLAQTP
ncbi:MAG: hypothetical protein ACK5CA_15175 [Cyanobacteriota bacterium]|jgi:hypothetical protein